MSSETKATNKWEWMGWDCYSLGVANPMLSAPLMLKT